MKQAGESIRAIKHIQKGVEEAAHIAPDSGIENMSTSGYEIEVQSEEEVVPPRARYGNYSANGNTCMDINRFVCTCIRYIYICRFISLNLYH